LVFIFLLFLILDPSLVLFSYLIILIIIFKREHSKAEH